MSRDALSTEQHFKVGEIAILIADPDWERPLSECQIVGRRRLFRFGYHADGSRDFGLFRRDYRVRDSAGEYWIVGPEELRKKRPPQNWKTLCKLDEVEHVH